MSHDDHLLELIRRADHSLVRTVDGLPEASWAEPSLLPDWSRGHVVAHLALNAEGLSRVLVGAHTGQPATMYDSPEARGSDIDELAAAPVGDVRSRLLAATTSFQRAMEAMHEKDWDARFERTPGGPSFAVANLPLMRVREVEVHHADLGAGYSPADWSPEFAVLLLDSMTKRPYPAPFITEATDLARTWSYGDGDGGPRVTGTSADLGWWLTGRGSGEGLACDTDALPRIDPW
jgi:maleylpyruvate isomerase